MIDFIIYDDEKLFLKKNKNLIDNFMMNYDCDYKCYTFDTYNSEFLELIKKNNSYKVYLLDIENETASGLEITRLIREKFGDWNSRVILITNHNEFKYDALSNRLYLMDFISKLDNWQDLLKQDLERIVSNYFTEYGCFVYENKEDIKRIPYKNIVYIEKEKDTKKCIIHTIYNDEYINENIRDVLKHLDRRFIKTSRSTIINTEQISELSKKNNIITFYNGKTTSDISRLYKKDLINCVKHLR